MQLDRLLSQQLTTSRIKPWIASLGRLTITGVVAASIGIVAIRKAHQSYWHKTIFRVQTNDSEVVQFQNIKRFPAGRLKILFDKRMCRIMNLNGIYKVKLE